MKIDKVWFVAAIKQLEEMWQKEYERDVALSKALNSYVILDNPLWGAIDNIFTKIVGDDIVNYYLFEENPAVTDENGKEWNLDSPESLWEYIHSYNEDFLE